MSVDVIAVLTSFNRKEKTIKSLAFFESAAKAAGLTYSAVLVDDASTDGTAQAVEQSHAWVRVIRGSGNLYWCRGMALAITEALKEESGHILWLNDDTDLNENALKIMSGAGLELKNIYGKSGIIVGCTTSDGSDVSYGGLKSISAFRKFSYQRVYQEHASIECDAMNGNAVLIAREDVQKIGNLDIKYEHAMGDIDYALMAKKLGIKIFTAPEIVGVCGQNSDKGTSKDASLGMLTRWEKMLSRKELPPKSWLHFTFKHGGVLAPLYFVWPYIKFWGQAFKSLPK
ncbi:glycosyltransferase family 2 protein [Iodobacter fluviatilis]|uniref:GT2 family glycosyltransferase n=1 Tax=Iodobacter fluviatilis TaxID=537 RepID=A0A377SU41_9NEIS|nr:glycosyltransferase family 2 protein [Iodobacter fluviatilis]TCU88031.1 GT2 family glycosyltransferase [Iodobacter fluviatilis]STR45532.1 rhamnosyltransferase [Iodobacter fluviatilis]